MDDANVKDTPPPSEAPSVEETVSEDIIKERVIPEETFSDDLKDVSPDHTIPIIVGVAVGILTLLLIFLFTKRRSLGRGMSIRNSHTYLNLILSKNIKCLMISEY